MAKKHRRLFRYKRERVRITAANIHVLREVVELFARDPLEAVERWALARAVELVGDSDEWKPPVELDPLTLKVHRLHWFSSELSRLVTDDPEPVEDLTKLLDALAELTLARRDGSIRAAESAAYDVGRLVERLDVVRHIEHAAAIGRKVSGEKNRLSPEERETRRKWRTEVDRLKSDGLSARAAYTRVGNGHNPKRGWKTVERAYLDEAEAEGDPPK